MIWLQITLMSIAGGIVGAVSPSAFDRDGWKFWLCMVAVMLAYTAGKIA